MRAHTKKSAQQFFPDWQFAGLLQMRRDFQWAGNDRPRSRPKGRKTEAGGAASAENRLAPEDTDRFPRAKESRRETRP
jgi:hypothetical protein